MITVREAERKFRSGGFVAACVLAGRRWAGRGGRLGIYPRSLASDGQGRAAALPRATVRAARGRY